MGKSAPQLVCLCQKLKNDDSLGQIFCVPFQTFMVVVGLAL